MLTLCRGSAMIELQLARALARLKFKQALNQFNNEESLHFFSFRPPI